MENCLVTSLKASVSDPENKYEIFGGCNFKASISANVNRQLIVVCSTGGADLKIVGNNVYFTGSNNQNLGQKIHIGNGSNFVTLHNGAAQTTQFRLVINGSVIGLKYLMDQSLDLSIKGFDFKKVLLYFDDITELCLYSYNAIVSFDSEVDDLSNFKSLELPYLSATNPDFHFHTADFTGYTNMEVVNLDGRSSGEATDISGNISAFGTCTKLTRLSFIYRNKINGNIEDMASAMVSNGRTSGTLTIIAYGANILYNGVQIGQKTITFNSSLPNGYSVS